MPPAEAAALLGEEIADIKIMRSCGHRLRARDAR